VPKLIFNGFSGARESVTPGDPIAKYTTCEGGLALDFESNSCAGCPAGYFPNLGACEMCRAGEISAAGDMECTPCPAGTFAAEKGSTTCTACSASTVAVVSGSSTCEPCNAGFIPNEDRTECAQCVHGSYAAAASAECTLCDPTGSTGFTTLTTGADTASVCTCKEGTFWNVRDDKCELCRDEAFCAGGLHLPVARKGKYGRYMGSVEAMAAAREAKLSGNFGSFDRSGAFYDIQVFNCGSLANCPGEDLTFSFGEYGLGALTEPELRVGFPAPPVSHAASKPCPPQRSGIACAVCEDGTYGTSGECMPCSGAAGGVNALIVIIFPFLMMSLYRATTSAGTARLQSAFVLVSTCGMAAFFMQTIAVLDTFAFNWPDELSWLFDISRVFMFDLGGLSLSCMHGNSFGAKYWASIMIPIFVVGMTFVGYGISKILPLPEDWKMQPNQTFSMIGMFMSALYITLVKVVLAYFECPGNPSAPDTLAKYKDIVCGEDEHKEGVVPMVLGLLVYVLGFYLTFCWAAYRAPALWTNVGYRERWKFMLTRWRPDTYYWGTALMTRNLLVAFAGVLSDEPRVQLCYVAAVVLVYLALTAVYQPWRAPTLNHYDVASCILLCFIGILGLIFVSVDEEISYAQRLQATNTVARKEDMKSAFARALTILISIFMALFGLLLCWSIGSMLPGMQEKNAKEHRETCDLAFSKLLKCTKSETFEAEAKRLIDESTAYDRAGLMNFISKIGVDPTSQASGTTDTISINKLKGNAPGTVSA